jgi:PAS domain S-box-containing protein
MSLDGRIASWNPAAETVSGFAANEVKGKAFSSLCTEEDRQAMEGLVRQVARGEKVQNAELTLGTRDGREVYIAWNCAPMLDDEGKVVGVVAVGRDLTERRGMEAELIRSSKMAALGVMASGIAHEIRNPLGIIAAAAQLLQERPDDKQLRLEALQRIHASIRRASLTIENLLGFSHPSSDNHEDVDVNALVEETLRLLTARIAQQRIDVRTELPPGLPAIWANRNLLQQVFTNILLNACNAMPDGGVLTVATREDPGGQMEIRFADTGHGIPQEHLPKVFDPFFTTMPVGKGTGLGLSISYSIVQQHQGSIEVTSEVGKGAMFTVRLPCSSGLLLRGSRQSSGAGHVTCGSEADE